MDLSFSELKDLVFNASMGSNLPAGVCEDLSFGVTFLESRSLPGGKELLYSLKCDRHPPISPQRNGVSLILAIHAQFSKVLAQLICLFQSLVKV